MGIVNSTHNMNQYKDVATVVCSNTFNRVVFVDTSRVEYRQSAQMRILSWLDESNVYHESDDSIAVLYGKRRPNVARVFLHVEPVDVRVKLSHVKTIPVELANKWMNRQEWNNPVISRLDACMLHGALLHLAQRSDITIQIQQDIGMAFAAIKHIGDSSDAVCVIDAPSEHTQLLRYLLRSDNPGGSANPWHTLVRQYSMAGIGDTWNVSSAVLSRPGSPPVGGY